MTEQMIVRRSLRELQTEYDKGNKQPLEDLVKAWAGIQQLADTDPLSFFVLGGYHGEPFQYRTDVKYLYWGGWCNHGNILFPTWHRIYLFKLEQALQSIVPGVALPYWDETSAESIAEGIPAVLTSPTFVVDGQTIANPLYSFTLPEALSDKLDEPVAGDPPDEYAKPLGYQTVRYPLSGLVGTPDAQKATAAHNALYPDPVKNTQLLNSNVSAWLKGAGPDGAGPTPQDPNPQGDGIAWLFETCLSAPNYTVFSNTTSAAEWNKENGGTVVPLEQPHNDIHLSVGGFDLPGKFGGESGQIAEANGDMGENNTAGLDPIFFFHHCNVDRMFWVWQQRNGFTDKVEVIAGYKGTNSSDSQGPTPDYAPDTELTLDSGLFPFTKQDGTTFTSNDAVNIEKQLGYTYDGGSLSGNAQAAKATENRMAADKKLAVSGIDRSLFKGSFVIRAYAAVADGNGGAKNYYLGHYSVLNRSDPVMCANCLNHLEVVAHFPLTNVPPAERDKVEYKISIQHRGDPKKLEPLAVGAKVDAVRKLSAALPAALAYKMDVVD
jgi:tyrosinase